MAINPHAVNDASSEADINHAKQACAAEVANAEADKRVVSGNLEEAKRAHANGEEVKDPSEKTKSTGDNRREVAADLVIDAVSGATGAKSLVEGAKLISDVVSDKKGASYNGVTGMDKAIKDGVRGGGSDAIFTKPLSAKKALPGRAKVTSSSINGEDKIKGAKAPEDIIAQLTQDCQLAQTKEMVFKNGLGQANQAGMRMGGEKLQAAQAGLTPDGAGASRKALQQKQFAYAQYNNDRAMINGPPPPGRKKPEESDEESWMG